MTRSGIIIFGLVLNPGNGGTRMLAPVETAVRQSLFMVPFLLLPERAHACSLPLSGKLPNDLLILLGWGKSNY
jgi:hypothetical protein